MNALELWRLRKLCERHELDQHLIDETLTYSENKKYLKSFMPDFNPESNLDHWESVEEQFMAEHPLWHYISCIREGKTTSEKVGAPIPSTRFSLREWILRDKP